MEKICAPVLLMLLLAPADWGWVNLRTPSYLQVFSRLYMWTWQEGQEDCKMLLNVTDLATIANHEQNEALVNMSGWIGFYRNMSNPEWRWSSGDGATTFTSWDTDNGQPADGNCAYKVYKDDSWVSGDCASRRADFICFEERLVLVKEEKTWEEAVEHCRTLEAGEQDQGYQLATLWTEDDLAFAREQAEGATTDEVWTGLRHLAGRWLWVAGEQVLLNQLPDCPAEGSCGALLIQGSQPIHTSNCELRKNFFCSKKHKDQFILVI